MVHLAHVCVCVCCMVCGFSLFMLVCCALSVCVCRVWRVAWHVFVPRLCSHPCQPCATIWVESNMWKGTGVKGKRQARNPRGHTETGKENLRVPGLPEWGDCAIWVQPVQTACWRALLAGALPVASGGQTFVHRGPPAPSLAVAPCADGAAGLDIILAAMEVAGITRGKVLPTFPLRLDLFEMVIPCFHAGGNNVPHPRRQDKPGQQGGQDDLDDDKVLEEQRVVDEVNDGLFSRVERLGRARRAARPQASWTRPTPNSAP